MEASDRTLKFNVMAMKGEVKDDDVKAHTRAKMGADRATMEEIESRYLKTTTEGEKPSKPEETPQAQLDKERATKAYRAFAKTARFLLLKEEILLDCEHTCLCCDQQFEPRSEFQKTQEGPYPLLVRSVIPPVQYLLAHKIFEAKTACTDPKLLDPENYVAICKSCKPVGFNRG